MNKQIFGVIPPLVTPMKENGDLDVEAYEKIINNCIEKGVHGIFTMGSCGEGSCVSRAMRLDVVKNAARIADGRVPVMAGVIEASTARVIEGIKELEQTGVEYFVVTPAFYIGCTCQDEIVRHYEKICKSVKAAIIVYNIPPMAHADILPETMVKLAAIDGIAAFKDSTSSWNLFQEGLFLKEKYNFTLLNGHEDLCGAGMLFGADGCVPSLGNVFPEIYVELFEAAQAGDTKRVYGIQKKIWELRTSFGVGKSWISVLKYICAKQGLMADRVSMPIETLTPGEKVKIDRIIDTALSR